MCICVPSLVSLTLSLTACVCGVQMPGPDIVRAIYFQMMDGHLATFDPEIAKLSGKLMDATIELHKLVMNFFLPSSVKFHYQFNLREMSNITQVRLLPSDASIESFLLSGNFLSMILSWRGSESVRQWMLTSPAFVLSVSALTTARQSDANN